MWSNLSRWRNCWESRRQLRRTLTQPLGKAMCFRERCFRKQEGKLLAAVATHPVRLAQGVAKQLGERLQNAVADGVSVAVVDGFEMIHVRHADAYRPRITVGTFELFLGKSHEMAAVEHPRQAVGRRLNVQFLASLPVLVHDVTQLPDGASRGP
jgi:hypothetical protein